MKTIKQKLQAVISVCIGFLFSLNSWSQEAFLTPEIATQQEEVASNSTKYPQFKYGGVFVGQYLDNLKQGVDINGLHHSEETYVSNSFALKRMRLYLNTSVSENLEVGVLVNLADFHSNVKGKVLENAYAKYTVNRYLQFTVGQFRPLFGREGDYSVDIVKSIDYSNSYYLFGANGWTSFQVGAALSGNVDFGKIPVNYEISATNGSGRNDVVDNGKHYMGKLLFGLDKKNDINVGFSGGIGEIETQKIFAVGVEARANLKLADRWSLDMQVEGKQGINQSLYFSIPEEERVGKLNDYFMKTFYFLPNLRYNVGNKHLNAIEFSCRYEYVDQQAHLDSNPRITWVPMLSFEIIKEYAARIELGMQIDNYRKNITNTTFYNSNLAFLQMQCRF